MIDNLELDTETDLWLPKGHRLTSQLDRIETALQRIEDKSQGLPYCSGYVSPALMDALMCGNVGERT